MNKLNIIAVLLMISLGLTGCDNLSQYQDKVQQDNDRSNPSGQRALCLAVGRLAKVDYPYTIQYLPGEIDKDNTWDPIKWNNKLNLRLAAYAKAGLFTEELVGEENGKPLYRYQFTSTGEQYAHWWGGGKTYFCFGRVVVEKMNAMYDLGSNKRITYQFHYENIPDWVKLEEVYTLYPVQLDQPTVSGQSVLGQSDYRLTYDGKLGQPISTASGRYTL